MRTLLALTCLILVISGASAESGPDTIINPENMARLDCALPDERHVFLGTNAPGQLLFPGESADVRLALSPGDDKGRKVGFILEIQGIHTRLPHKNPDVYVDPYGHPDIIAKEGEPTRHAFEVAFGDGEKTEIELKGVPVPKRQGTYAFILVKDDLRQFLGTCARVPSVTPGTVEDTPLMGEGVILSSPNGAKAVARMGIRLIRGPGGWSEREDGSINWEDLDRVMTQLEDAGVKSMVSLGAHPGWTWTFGPRQTPAAVTPGWDHNPYWGQADWLANPSFYPRYEKWIEEYARRYHKGGAGALWGIEHYNEPWEGGGISGWARDLREYREILKCIARACRRVSKDLKVLAASSEMNTEDKLFSDPDANGDFPMAEHIDIMTSHYGTPHGCYGPLVAEARGKISIESETWLAISEYLVPQLACQLMASGQKIVLLWHPRTVFGPVPGVKDEWHMPTTVAVATAVWNHFVTGRRFEKLIFRDHIPWLFQFGKDEDPEALVVMFGALIHRHGPTPQDGAGHKLWRQVDAAKDPGSITIDNRDRLLRFFDTAGNQIHEGEDSVTIVLDHSPTYLFSAKGPKAIGERIAASPMEGRRPVEILPHDFEHRLSDPDAVLTVDVANRINRALTGTLTVTPPEGLTLVTNSQPVKLMAGESKPITFTIASATANAANAYDFAFSFTSDAGSADYAETLNTTILPRLTPTIDGDLSDWSSVPSMTVRGLDQMPHDLSELARKPWLEAKEIAADGTAAEFRMAWDEANVYVCAQVYDPTPQMDKRRMEGRDDDWYFHQASSDQMEPWKSWLTQEGLAGRSFAEVPWVYRYSPNSEQAAPYDGDRLHLAFNVTESWHDLKPTTDRVPYGFHAVPDTDYEFTLYACNDGRSELWQLLKPGAPRIHFFPRQPKGVFADLGPTPGARHVVVDAEKNVRIYECAIPKSYFGKDLALEAGETFQFTWKVGNDRGPKVTYGFNKAVAKMNGLTMHRYWHSRPSASVRWRLVE